MFDHRLWDMGPFCHNNWYYKDSYSGPVGDDSGSIYCNGNCDDRIAMTTEDLEMQVDYFFRYDDT